MIISKLGDELKLQRYLTHSRYWQQFVAWQCGASWTTWEVGRVEPGTTCPTNYFNYNMFTI